MTLNDLQIGQFAKVLDTIIVFKLPNGEYDFACEGQKLKSGKSPIDLKCELATKEQFIEAVNKADHQGDWYSMLLKDLMLKRFK